MDKLLSLCMIVKNEEKTLARCLESVQGIADEIIVVDTGSTDRTKEIANQYTSHVYDFVWINDFAAAKNEAIRRATAKWILVLDGDEYLQPGQEESFRTFLKTYEVKSPVGIMVKIMNYHGESDRQITSVMESSAARLFPNHQGIVFERPIHEQLAVKKGNLGIFGSSFVVLHTGYLNSTVAEKKKSERNMNIIQSFRSNEPYDLYTLGNEYFSTGDNKNAHYNYSKALQKAKPDLIWVPYCYEGLIMASLKLARLQDAYDTIQTCLRKWPHHVDFHYLLGEVHYALGFNDLAEQQFKACIQLAEEKERMGQQAALIRLDYARYLPARFLSEIYIRRNDWNQAIFYLTKAVSTNNGDMQLLFHLLKILSRTEAPDAIQSLLGKIYPIEHVPSNASLLFRMSCMVGQSELAKSYWDICEQLGIELGSLDKMHYALLVRDQALFDLYLEKPGHISDNAPFDKLIASASLIWNDVRYADRISTANREFRRSIQQFIQGAPEDASVHNSLVAQWSLLLQDLFTLGCYEVMDAVLARFPTPDMYQKLADYLYTQGQTELAVDYYSLLLENNCLEPSGFEHLAYLYLYLGETEQGLSFLEKAIEGMPGNTVLYVLYCSFCQDSDRKKLMKQQLLDLVPQYRKLPFLAAL